MTASHSVTLIISSYNQPNCLALMLEGVARQDFTDFDIVVGDDGSDPDTFELFDRFAQRGLFEVETTTQADEGFRKAAALNNAVRKARGDQLVFMDGDCIPYEDTVRTHVEAFDPERYSVAGYVHLTMEQSQALTVEGVARGDHEHLASPAQMREFRSIHWHNHLYRWLRKPRKPKVLGGNFSVGRELLASINGFDNRFVGIGGEDSDIRNRLNNYGARGISLWNRAFVCHLDHGLDERRCHAGVLRTKNRGFIKANRRITRTPDGLTR